MKLQWPRVSLKLYIAVLIAFVVVGVVLIPLTVQGIVPIYLGYILFALIVAWIPFDPRWVKGRR